MATKTTPRINGTGKEKIAWIKHKLYSHESMDTVLGVPTDDRILVTGGSFHIHLDSSGSWWIEEINGGGDDYSEKSD